MRRKTITAFLHALDPRPGAPRWTDRVGERQPLGRGFIEAVEWSAGRLGVHGWLFPLEGTTDGYRLDIDGRPLAQAPARQRSDVATAFSGWPQASRSGFALDGRVAAGASRRWSTLDVVALRAGVETGRIRLRYRPDFRAGLADPPTALRLRVVRSDSLPAFWFGGQHVFGELAAAIGQHRAPHSVRRLLDGGCGSRRLTGLFAAHWPRTEAHGCDLDPEAIAWCRENLPRARFLRTAPTPPTPYPDASFDVVTAYSVLTHLDRRAQTAWLTELRRLLAPGGLLLASLHGDFALRFETDARVARDIAEAGISDRLPDDALDGVAAPGSYRCVYQTRDYSLRELTPGFDVLEYRSAPMTNFQDLLVLRRRRG